MDLLDRLLGHDEWTTGELLWRCHELTGHQLDQRYDIGHETVRTTVVHMIDNVRIWTQLMGGGPLDADDSWESGDIGRLEEEHATSYAAFANLARDVGARQAWNDTWIDTLDDPPQTKTYGGAILHVITHNMHHRGEVLHMLKRLGLSGLPEGDLLGWESLATAEKGLVPR